MTVTNHWPVLIRTLMTETGESERRLSASAKVNRNTMRRFLAGKTDLPLLQIERMLAVFGYELDAIAPPSKKEGAPCHMQHHPSAHVVA